MNSIAEKLDKSQVVAQLNTAGICLATDRTQSCGSIAENYNSARLP